MSKRSSPPYTLQQDEQTAKALADRSSEASTNPTPSPAFYPPRLEHRSSYEQQRPAGSSRRPYDAVLDASPPPSSVLTDPLRGSRPSSSTSRPFSAYGMPNTPDLHSTSSSSSQKRTEAPVVVKQARRTSRADQQQPYPSPTSRPARVNESYIPEPSSYPGESSSYPQSQQTSSSRLAPRVERRKPSLEGWSGTRGGLKYRLVVVQHPTRARMCGFGDKDRRPLSPTLIVKLIVTDEKTGEEISPWKVNTSLFFLASDLCHPDDLMLSPRNVLVHQHAASVPAALLQPSYNPDYQQQQQRTTSPYGPPGAALSSGSNAPLPPLGSLYLSDRSRSQQHTTPTEERPPPLSSVIHSYPSALTTVTTEHYTRNLVGAAVTSANVLRDEQDNHCIFFVLQDLSVRTEGNYRIRLMFTNLALYDGQTNEGVSEALAEAYTEPFSVYSPRRFPGMLEPTELSKKLASQGIKIAVRSDKKKRQRSQEEAGEGSVIPGEAEGLEEEEDE